MLLLYLEYPFRTHSLFYAGTKERKHGCLTISFGFLHTPHGRDHPPQIWVYLKEQLLTPSPELCSHLPPFSGVTSHLWNVLPLDVSLASVLLVSRCQVETFLFVQDINLSLPSLGLLFGWSAVCINNFSLLLSSFSSCCLLPSILCAGRKALVEREVGF